MSRFAVVLVAAGLSCAWPASPSAAQTLAAGEVYLQDSRSPFGPVGPVDGSGVAMPALAFSPSAEDPQNYDKYYAFHRAGTDFATAYSDLMECDGYARGLQDGIGNFAMPYIPGQSVLAAGLGGAIGGAMVQAIFGSGEKRRLRRVNMRTCMNFKGYDRYGLSKEVWEKFNFEEGLSGLDEVKRTALLRQQALVASQGTMPGKALGL